MWHKFKFFIALVFIALGILFLPAILQAHQLPLPSGLILLDSPVGQRIIAQHLNHHFWKLDNEFLTQKNQTYCGIASMAMVLNALDIDGPNDPVYVPFRPFTQDNFFSVANVSAISLEDLAKQGMTLDQAASLLTTLPVKVQTLHADQLTLNKFRALLKHEKNNRYIIANFLRDVLQEQKGGHFSPIGVYDQKYDRVLIFDVARYKYPLALVKTEDLWKAINTIDSTSEKYRGLLIIESNNKPIH